jgi:hypothetical protein
MVNGDSFPEEGALDRATCDAGDGGADRGGLAEGGAGRECGERDAFDGLELDEGQAGIGTEAGRRGEADRLEAADLHMAAGDQKEADAACAACELGRESGEGLDEEDAASGASHRASGSGGEGRLCRDEGKGLILLEKPVPREGITTE